MAQGPHEHEGSSLELDHLHTEPAARSSRRLARAFGSAKFGSRASRPATRAGVRRSSTRVTSRESRRAALSSLTLVGVALAALFAGGAVLSSASGSPSSIQDPQANTVRAVGGAPSYGPGT